MYNNLAYEETSLTFYPLFGDKSVIDAFIDLAYSIASMSLGEWLICFCVLLFSMAAYLFYEVVKFRYNDKHHIWVPKCYREDMVEEGGCILRMNQDGTIEKVEGNLYGFLRDMPESSKLSNKELYKVFVKYCYYVDKHYGTDPEFVELNIGKDCKNILALKYM